MTTVSDIFRARAESFGATMTGGSGLVSYKIPEYQRHYDWGESNVRRLLHDCLNGLKSAAAHSTQHPYTFLGTIILAPDESKEPTFDGQSLSVVDGQQRLTTLLLLSSALYGLLRYHKSDINSVSDQKVLLWLEDEHKIQSQRLYWCTTGQTIGISSTDPFPRLVRTEDTRGHSFSDAEYTTVIADFLAQFRSFCLSQKNEFDPTFDGTEQESHLVETYGYIRRQIETYVYSGQEPEEDDEFPLSVLDRADFQRSGCRGLFAKLADQGTHADHIASFISSDSEIEKLVRLLLFASYVIESVVLTVVEAPTEDLAFDIFDALNTTGEPLTALETLKPHVVRFENVRNGSFGGSPSELDWTTIEKNVIEPYSNPQTRVRETQDLVIGFALYVAGQKIGRNLGVQRNTLRSYFMRASSHSDEVTRQYVHSLANFAEYRRNYWPKDNIDAIVGPVNERHEYDLLRLCLRFIRDTGTSTTIPILARYGIEFGEMNDCRDFLNAAKATAAYLAIRRGMTGRTDRIDSEFRDIMSGASNWDGTALCLGGDLSNPILSIDELKDRYRTSLAEHRYKVENKDSWLSRACEVPLANQTSREVCRFLLLAAAQNAHPDSSNPGLSVREGFVVSDEQEFMNHKTWTASKYATLEHVAPDSPTSGGWDSLIYEHSDTRHTIGNLVLLPEKENQSIGNAPWVKKKFFYRALAAETVEVRNLNIELAEQEGLEFGNKTRLLLEQQERLHILESVAKVEDWTIDLVNRRTENILSLAWDAISPWLYE